MLPIVILSPRITMQLDRKVDAVQEKFELFRQDQVYRLTLKCCHGFTRLKPPVWFWRSPTSPITLNTEQVVVMISIVLVSWALCAFGQKSGRIEQIIHTCETNPDRAKIVSVCVGLVFDHRGFVAAAALEAAHEQPPRLRITMTS